MSHTKRVYTFGNGKAEGKAEMKNLLGGKGANLAEMNLIGVPVPPGFTITTDVCNEYFEKGKDNVVAELKPEVEAAMAGVEELMKSKILLKDYKKSLENFKEYSNREYYDLCKEISKDIKQKWYNNFYDYLNLITLSEEGIFNMLYPYSDNINKLVYYEEFDNI